MLVSLALFYTDFQEVQGQPASEPGEVREGDEAFTAPGGFRVPSSPSFGIPWPSSGWDSMLPLQGKRGVLTTGPPEKSQEFLNV